MPKFDLTISISVILAICAIISPIATTIINNVYQLKLKKLKYKQKEIEAFSYYKRGVYEDYVRYTGQCLARPAQRDNLEDYGKFYGLALIYFSEELISDLQQLDTAIYNRQWDLANSLWKEFTPKIRNALKSM